MIPLTFNSSMPTFLSRLEEVNDLAIGHLCEGSYAEAEAIFLTLLAVAGENQEQLQISDALHLQHSRIYGKQAMLAEVSLKHVLGDDDTPMECPTASFGFYHYAFGAEICPNNHNDLQVFSAMVAYNIAVMQHGFGVLEGSVPKLHRARQFYELTLKILEHSTASAILELSTYNNLGHLCSFFQDTLGMQLNRNALSKCLSSAPGGLDSEALAFFRSSLSRTSRVSYTLAAAA